MYGINFKNFDPTNCKISTFKMKKALEEIWGLQKTTSSQIVGTLGTLPFEWSDVAKTMPC